MLSASRPLPPILHSAQVGSERVFGGHGSTHHNQCQACNPVLTALDCWPLLWPEAVPTWEPECLAGLVGWVCPLAPADSKYSLGGGESYF